MQISGMSSAFHTKPSAPTAPTPPPGGNIENRRPPSEPSAPNIGGPSGGVQTGQQADPLSQFVSQIDGEYGTNIKSSLDNLSEEGRSALKIKLEAFKNEAESLNSDGRSKGFLQIMTDVFKEFGGDYQSTGNLLSAYA